MCGGGSSRNYRRKLNLPQYKEIQGLHSQFCHISACKVYITVESGKTLQHYAMLRRYTLIDIMKEADTSIFQAQSKNAHRLQN